MSISAAPPEASATRTPRPLPPSPGLTPPMRDTGDQLGAKRRGETPMKIPKPTEADRERFTALVPEAPQVEVKPMFGNLGAFVNGNMFMGLFGSDVGVKLPDDDQQRLLAEPGAGPFGPEERPMAGYVTLPADWTDEVAGDWIGKSLDYVSAMPPKKPKAAKAPAKPRR